MGFLPYRDDLNKIARELFLTVNNILLNYKDLLWGFSMKYWR
ncbi:hypothetical protein XBKB1_3710007 [Xenorhabdus bovienii str. kraussei Becker Underwood]|uniref:Uncharacterized protein n=1 Tax=Xenorhabdus bovienii str. kraussei Becker Underwood TaxID=1398204 RepID=A0A077PZE7_XENBV|nr:hypothetical protein XBKB1_3710007 [Xenorhabdus bovienii str. kraussei Becker Underwood]